MRIVRVTGREILDSRGNPTIECEVELESGIIGVASVPSGASTGENEALELRDGDPKRYGGKGVLKAVANINEKIAPEIIGMSCLEQRAIDEAMIKLDGTATKSNLGANAILGVSLACARAAAEATGQSLYNYIGGVNAKTLPVPMMNILNGGAHATNNVDIQEFMIMPVSAKSWKEALRMCAEVFHALKKVVPASGVGDEGGYAPNLDSDEDALKALVAAMEKAGYKPGEDFMLAIDAAVSDWYNHEDGTYTLPKAKKTMTRSQMVNMWKKFADTYPIISMEDCMGEDDWEGWAMLTKALGDKKGINRYGMFYCPMDEALTRIVIDLSGRPYLVYDVKLAVERIGTFETEMLKEFLYALADHGRMNLHVTNLYGENAHHIVESVFKGLGHALKEAVRIEGDETSVLSTKGVL